MTARSSLTVVLAAGEGTRMRSSLPKVLHQVAGQSLLAHVLNAAPHGAGAALAVVIGPDHKAVAGEVKLVRADAATFVQAERLGTAHAVLAASEAITRGADDLLVAFGDTPLISAETFARLRAPLAKGATLAVLGFRAADPTGYGRLLLENGRLVAIREHADASEAERKVTEEEVREHVAARLASFKVPARVWIAEDELPRNASGKVLKRELRESLLP